MLKCPEDSTNIASSELRAKLTKKTLAKLYLAIGLCTFFMAIELFGGYLANSLAIMSDAVHLLSDIAGFLTSIVAIIISRRSASSKYTFGFQRAQTLGALISVAFVWIITAYLVLEAIERIRKPEPINGKFMFFTALFGVIVNLVLAFSLEHGNHSHSLGESHDHSHNTIHTHKHEDINIRAALIHVIGDLVQSVGVLIASGIIWYNEKWRIADPICTLFFSVIVIVSTLFISRDILRILMEGAPKSINIDNIYADLHDIEGVEQVHDLHVWAISPGSTALTVHVKIKPDHVQEEVLHQVQEMLCTKYIIHHSTIQIEKIESLHCNPVFCSKNY